MKSTKKKPAKKKSSGSSEKKQWRCSKCPGWDANPHVCKHLEEAMGRTYASQSVGAFPVRRIDEFVAEHMNEIEYDYPFSPSSDDLDPVNIIIPPSIANGDNEADFRADLKRYGLPRIQIEILTLRFFYDMSLRDIAKELMITSPGIVLNQMSRALKDLKARGYGG